MKKLFKFTGIVLAVVVIIFVFLIIFLWYNREVITSAPLIRDARNTAISVSKKSVRLSGCVADPPEIRFTTADYKEEKGNQFRRSATLTLINADGESHQISISGIAGTITLAPYKTNSISLVEGGGNNLVLTCDGKESLKITTFSVEETSGSAEAQIRQSVFNSLSAKISNCTDTVLGQNRLQELFNGTLTITSDDQVKLSSCIYKTLSAGNQKCVADLAGGAENVETFFRNIPKDKLGSLGKCMDIERYNSLLVIPQSK